MPLVRVSNGGSLPDTLTLSAIQAYSSGGYATVTVPHAITDNYTKFALTSGNGYVYRDALNNAVKLTVNTKYDLASYSFTNWIGTTSSSGYGSYASITFYNE